MAAGSRGNTFGVQNEDSRNAVAVSEFDFKGHAAILKSRQSNL